MDGPGDSLYQGFDNLQGNTSYEKEEEEEAREDQRRRDVEIGGLLQHAFDDMTDDEDDDDDDSRLNCSCTPILGSDDQRQSLRNAAPCIQDNHNILDHSNISNFGTHENDVSNRGGFNLDYMPKSVIPRLYDNYQQHNSNSVQGYQLGLNRCSEENESLVSRDDAPSVRNEETKKGDLYSAGVDTDVSSHYHHCIQERPGIYRTALEVSDLDNQDANERYRRTSFNSQEQLKVLYEVRVREVQRLSEELEALSQKSGQEKDRLQRKLVVKEAEKDKAEYLNKQAQELLVTAKQKTTDLENEVQTLKINLKNEDKSKTELNQELGAARISLLDLQHKVALLERGNLHGNEKHMDTFLRNVQKQHDKDLKVVQKQLDTAVVRLSTKEKEYELLERRIMELTRVHEGFMVEKGETINQLSRSLEDSQRQCQQLMASNVSQDNVRLTMRVSALTEENKTLQHKLLALTRDVESLQSDLKRWESFSNLGLMNDSSETDSMVQLGIRSKSCPKLADGHMEMIAKLKDELHRCIVGQKSKREEILRLKTQLQKKDEHIKVLRDQETKYLAEAEKFKEDGSNLLRLLNDQDRQSRESKAAGATASKLTADLTLKLEQLETELTKALRQRDEVSTAGDQLRREIASLSRQVEEARSQTADQSSEEYLRFHDRALARVREEVNQEFQVQLADLGVRLEQSLKETDEAKQLYIQVCFSKEEIFSQLKAEQDSLKDMASRLEAESEKLASLKEERETEREALTRLSIELKLERARAVKLTEELEVERKAREINSKDENYLKGPEEECKRDGELERSCQLHQLTAECERMKQQLRDAERKQSEFECDRKQEVLSLAAKLEKQESHAENLKEQLSIKERTLEKLSRPNSRDASTSPVKVLEDLTLERIRKEVAVVYTTEFESLREKHQTELREREEHIKEEAVRYFESEIHSTEVNRRAELQRVEMEYSNNLAALRLLIETKVKEIEQLNAAKTEEKVKMAAKQAEGEIALETKIEVLNKEMEELKDKAIEIEKRKERIQAREVKCKTKMERLSTLIEEKDKQMNEDRTTMADLLKTWSAEVQSLRDSQEEANMKYEALQAKYKSSKKLAGDYEVLQDKYKSVKKLAVDYKAYTEKKETYVFKKFRKIEESYREALMNIQSQLGEMLQMLELLESEDNDKVRSKISECGDEIKVLRHKLSKFKKNT